MNDQHKNVQSNFIVNYAVMNNTVVKSSYDGLGLGCWIGIVDVVIGYCWCAKKNKDYEHELFG